MDKKGNILLVDDDVSILKSFKHILEKDGYVVETAETGYDALEKLRKEKFDLYIIDVVLPDMSGTELLRKTANYPAAKIIITGFSSEAVGNAAADLGADDYLVKPVGPKELLASIEERLSNRTT